MDFKIFAEHMYPCWILGIIAIILTLAAGKKHLLRIEKKAVWNWCKFLLYVTAIRFAISKLNLGMYGNAPTLPLAVPFTVFWEDACHGLPLLLLSNMLPDKKWAKALYWVALVLFSISFGLGHLYQGLLAAFLLSFYIKYSVDMGRKYGIGTVMICHMMYDMATLLFIKLMSGL